MQEQSLLLAATFQRRGLLLRSWNTRGLLGLGASGQRPRENKLRYLTRVPEKSDILYLQETRDRSSTLLNIDAALERPTWENFGTFTPGKVNSGVSDILIRKCIFGSGFYD